jgi:hypothetical protein
MPYLSVIVYPLNIVLTGVNLLQACLDKDRTIWRHTSRLHHALKCGKIE